MDSSGHDFLSRSGLSRDQHGGVRAGYLLDLGNDASHGRALSDQATRTEE